MSSKRPRRTIYDDDDDDDGDDNEKEFDESPPSGPPKKQAKTTIEDGSRSIKKWLNPGASKKTVDIQKQLAKKEAAESKAAAAASAKTKKSHDALDDVPKIDIKKKDKKTSAPSLLAKIAPPANKGSDNNPNPSSVAAGDAKKPSSGGPSSHSSSPNRMPPKGSGGGSGNRPSKALSASSSRDNNPAAPAPQPSTKREPSVSPVPPPPRQSPVPAPMAPTRTSNSSTAAAPPKAKGVSGLPIAMQEKVILTRLQSFCEQLSTAEQATFSLPESSTIDVGGSFLPPNSNYDFFDLNEAGEIVLPAKPIPMFPEDFDAEHMEHPLSWWGVLDYEAGKGKFAPPPPPPGYPAGPHDPHGYGSYR